MELRSFCLGGEVNAQSPGSPSEMNRVRGKQGVPFTC